MVKIIDIIWLKITSVHLTVVALKTQNNRRVQKSFQSNSNLSDLIQTGVTVARPDM